MKSLTPGQQVVKIVNDELKELMGSTESKIEFSSTGLTVIMLVGLQGAGKTTMAGKLALQLRKNNKKPLLVACDIYRPAAIKQLQVVGSQIDIPVFSMGDKVIPVDIAKASIEHAKKDRKSTRLNSSHANISYAVFCLKKKKKHPHLLCLHTV